MNVFVTGVSRGIGKAVVLEFLKVEKIDTIYIGTSSPNENQFHSDKVVSIHLDFLKDDWVDNVYNIIGNTSIDILINNAGYLANEVFEDANMKSLQKMIAINYSGPFHLVQVLLPNLKISGAHILNIGSMGGFQGSSKFKGLSGYSSTKAALANLSECWAEEFKEYHIKSNCIALGAVQTEMLEEAFPGYSTPMTADIIAVGIVKFALDAGVYMNGKVIPFSGVGL